MPICDRCGSPAAEKWITSNKTGKQHKLFECQGQCMNGRFKYSFFPPRDSGHMVKPQPASYVPPVTQPQVNIPSYVLDIIDRLKSIDTKLVEIKASLKIGGRANFTHDEMSPDENVPF